MFDRMKESLCQAMPLVFAEECERGEGFTQPYGNSAAAAQLSATSNQDSPSGISREQSLQIRDASVRVNDAFDSFKDSGNDLFPAIQDRHQWAEDGCRLALAAFQVLGVRTLSMSADAIYTSQSIGGASASNGAQVGELIRDLIRFEEVLLSGAELQRQINPEELTSANFDEMLVDFEAAENICSAISRALKIAGLPMFAGAFNAASGAFSLIRIGTRQISGIFIRRMNLIDSISANDGDARQVLDETLSQLGWSEGERNAFIGAGAASATRNGQSYSEATNALRRAGVGAQELANSWR